MAEKAVSVEKLTRFKTKADTRYAYKSHSHGNSEITGIDASKITSGTISIDRLPAGALERLVTVADDASRLKLTTANVQLGDTVQVTSTGKMYFVIDESKLNAEAGYKEYTAGTATSVPWSGVTNKPNRAGSSTDGGSANSAVKLDTSSAGSATQPVYFSGGKPVAGTYTLGKSVPSDAKFTDTTYSNMSAATATAAGKSGLVPAPAAGKQSQYLRGDGTWATPTNTAYSAATTSAAGLMSAADKTKLDNLTWATDAEIDAIFAA